MFVSLTVCHVGVVFDFLRSQGGVLPCASMMVPHNAAAFFQVERDAQPKEAFVLFCGLQRQRGLVVTRISVSESVLRSMMSERIKLPVN